MVRAGDGSWARTAQLQEQRLSGDGRDKLDCYESKGQVYSDETKCKVKERRHKERQGKLNTTRCPGRSRGVFKV